MTLIDSNVLVDIFTKDPVWLGWSLARLEDATAKGPLVVNDVIYAECSVRYASLDYFETILFETGISMIPIPRPALFLAGKAFANYRRASGAKTGVLPDFFIGAHAVVSRLPLLTRDVRRYRTYFPGIDLIAP